MIEKTIRLAQVRFCYESTLLSQFVTFVNGTLLLAFLHSVIDIEILGTWLAAMLGIGALRIAVYVKFHQCPDPSAQLHQWEIVSLAGAIIAGMLWGSAGFFLFAAESVSHQAFLAFVIGGMTAGAVTTLSPHLPSGLAFIFLANTPLAYRFAVTTHPRAMVGQVSMLR